VYSLEIDVRYNAVLAADLIALIVTTLTALAVVPTVVVPPRYLIAALPVGMVTV
jgi:hypothetical protein